MDIAGYDILHISHLMEQYVKDYYAGRKTLINEGCLFAEVMLLGVDEVSHLILDAHKVLFKVDGMVNGASGFIRLRNEIDGTEEDFTVMLMMNDSFTRAHYLYVADEDEAAILIKDFLSEKGT